MLATGRAVGEKIASGKVCHIKISNEAIALFARFWLPSTPPLPDTAQQQQPKPKGTSVTKV